MIPFTSFNLNNIKNLLESKSSNDEVEFKIRTPFLDINKSLKYDSNISEQYFNNLLKFDHKPLYREISDVQSYDNYRSINITETSQKNVKPGFVYNFKQRNEVIDFNFYFLELRLSKSIDKTISEKEFKGFLSSLESKIPFIRKRFRYVYKLNDHMELHLTVIKDNKTVIYECEFEINKGISISDLVKTLEKYLFIMTNITTLPRNEEVISLTKQYNKMIDNQKSHRNELIDIKLSDVKNMKNTEVSNKLDGIQYYFFIFNNTIYLFNPLRITQTNSNSLKIYRVNNINSDLNYTILAGEYLSQSRDYNIFDTLFYKNKNVENLKFSERLHYIPLILNELKNVKIDNLNLLTKPFFYQNNIYYSTLKTILYMYHLYKEKTIEENDGIIFIPEDDPYINNKSKKWKFWQRRSIDVGLITTSNKNVFKMYTGNKDPFSINDKNTITINESFPDFKKLENGSIIEVRYVNNEIVPDKLRTDKVYPNATWVSNAIKEDMLHIIYLTDLLSEMKKYYPLTDKEKENINENKALEIARKWDGINERENKNEKENKNEVKSYEQPKQQECFIEMRKYHNKLKRQLINSTIGKTKKNIIDVIDIGGGKLGDLDKYWATKKINRVYIIEPNKEYIEAGNKRIDVLIKDKNIQLDPKAKTNTFIINEPLQNIKPILEKLKNKVDFISSFFSLTFLFESEKDVDLLVNFLSDKLNEEGYFIGTTMDGMKTRTLLDEEKGKITLGNCGSITRLYDPLKGLSYGDKIELKLGTATVDKQIESLVYFDILTKKLQEKRIKLIQSDFFLPKDLNKDETLLSSLNRFFIFKKEAPITRELNMLNEHQIVAFDNEIAPDIQLVRIGSLGENHCFYHAYMYSTSEKYRNASHEEKRKMTANKRKEISNKITLEDYKKEGNGQTLIVEFLNKAKKELNISEKKFDELNKLIGLSDNHNVADEFLKKFEKKLSEDHNEKELKNYIDTTLEELLQEFKTLIGNCQITHAAIPFLMKKLEINIIMIRDSTRKLYDNLLTDQFNDNNLYIIMLNLGNYHYETVGVLYTDKDDNALIDYTLFNTEELPMIVKGSVRSKNEEKKEDVKKKR